MTERKDKVATEVRKEIIVNNLKPPQGFTPTFDEAKHEVIAGKLPEPSKPYYPPTGRKKKKEGYESNTGLKDINDQKPPQNNPKEPYIPLGKYWTGPRGSRTAKKSDQLPQEPTK